ncbi:LutC/YkgG family protein [Bacillus xiapuensis]|uniref:LutC/YkgG family protein n=1 Tax=Bacillus xiapuensis TaxID=2014075 RepID=UPI000C23525A|nr:lactate utilization protein [Bacillus xiapuensis]
MNKADFLQNIRTRLGRSESDAIAPYPKGIPEGSCDSADSPDEWLRMYKENLEAVHGEVFTAKQAHEVQHFLKMIIERHGAQSLIRWDDEELAKLNIDEAAAQTKTKMYIWNGQAAKEANIAIAKHADIGITSADFAIADTGTAVLIYNEKKGRSVSLLPPVHVIIFKQEQLVFRMGDIFPRLREKDFSTLHFLTGPSKSADIELQMTTGVHGPKHVYAIVQAE